MTLSSLQTYDAYVWEVVEQVCTKIRAQFPEATFDVCKHPTQRGAIIDAHVTIDDDFAILDLVNPALDELLLAEGMAISVRALGPSPAVSVPRGRGAGSGWPLLANGLLVGSPIASSVTFAHSIKASLSSRPQKQNNDCQWGMGGGNFLLAVGCLIAIEYLGQILLDFLRVAKLTVDMSEENLSVSISDFYELCLLMYRNLSARASTEYIFETPQPDGTLELRAYAGGDSIKTFGGNFLKRLAEVFFNLKQQLLQVPQTFQKG